MIIACNNAIKDNISLFLGSRNNDKNKDEPYPSDLINMLKIMCGTKDPFAMDVDNGVSVWNYSYDSVKVIETKNYPFEYKPPPEEGETLYYNFKINSSVYPEQNQDIWGYINTTTEPQDCVAAKTKTERWISHKHPDFLWRKYRDENCWQGKCKINPEVDAKNGLYDIQKFYFRKQLFRPFLILFHILRKKYMEDC